MNSRAATAKSVSADFRTLLTRSIEQAQANNVDLDLMDTLVPLANQMHPRLGSAPMPLKGLNVYVVGKREDGLK